MSSEKSQKKIEDAINSHKKGRNFRPSFHALWHLEKLGVVDDLKTFESEIWDQVEQEAEKKAPVVVVMDTPTDYEHRNLGDSIDLSLMRDFSIFNDGAFPIGTSRLDDSDQQRRAKICREGGASWINSQQAMTINSEVEDKSSSPRRSVATRQKPGAHGTAVSGLIGGCPTEAPLTRPAYIGEVIENSESIDVDLPYAGINPFARIVPVTLTAAPYPDMVLGALDYISAIDPDVVVIAAAWATDMDRHGMSFSDDDSLPLEQNEHGFSDPLGGDKPTDSTIWKHVEDKLKSLSNTSIVLCAAGNIASDKLAFPASLCGEKDNNIWAVAACDGEGEELSYSPKVEPKRRMLKTLSTQLPRSDRDETVVDPFVFKAPELQQQLDGHKVVSSRDIVTLDPSGRQGYNPTENPNPGPEDGTLLEIGSLFARFSGTSAATAIAGGLVSLVVLPDRKMNRIRFDPNILFDLEQAKLLFGRS